MTETPPDEGQLVEQADARESNGAGGRPRSVRTWQFIVAGVVVVALATAIGVVVGRRSATNEQVSTESTEAATTSTEATTASTTSPGATAAPQTGYTAPIQMAARDLDGFLTHATMADQALTEAASRINASSTATEITYDQRTIDLLGSAAPSNLAPWLPPGMPDPLQRQALLVYSDLVSRWGAMGGLCAGQGVGTFPRTVFDDLGCFVLGAPAAARFDGDFAALGQLAETTPKFTIPSQDSQAAEELAEEIIRLAFRTTGRTVK